jgi:ComF family protein
MIAYGIIVINEIPISSIKILIGMPKIFDNILNLIFPPRCEVCKKENKGSMCPECFSRIKFMKPYLGIHSVSVYEGELRTAIHRFKFKKRKKLAQPLGVLLVNYLGNGQTVKMDEIDIIVPVPLHRKRLRERGFNQVKLLGESISKYYEVPTVSALERTRNTDLQFGLPREQRFKNVRGAFKIADSKAVYNKRVLLLDDIYTTGATIAECSTVLKRGGAKRVEILTLSRALDHTLS